VELRVDEDALIRRIESRIAATKAQGEALRDDDSPEVLHRRLAAYRDQTAPLITYYQLQGVLRSLDGMAPIAQVAAEIERVLAGKAAKAPPKLPKSAPKPPRAAADKPPRPRIGKRIGKKSKAPPAARRCPAAARTKVARTARRGAARRPKAGNRKR
jgi:adenylate kinase